MVKTIQIRVDQSLKDILEDLRKRVAVDIKKEYNIKELTVPQTLSSQILAAKMNGHKHISFKIRKINMNKGILELL